MSAVPLVEMSTNVAVPAPIVTWALAEPAMRHAVRTLSIRLESMEENSWIKTDYLHIAAAGERQTSLLRQSAHRERETRLRKQARKTKQTSPGAMPWPAVGLTMAHHRMADFPCTSLPRG